MEVLQRTANRGSISTDTGYKIDNSLKVENDNREYLRWTNFSTYASSARKKKFSMSCWLKRTELGRQMIFWSTAQNGYFSFDAGDTLTWIQQYGGSQLIIRTNRVFRDTSAWYHLMVVVDTAQSTEADRTKIYVNGVQETSFDTATYPSQDAESSNLYEQHLILGEWGGGSTGFSGYIADYYFLSEIAASPTDLGEFDSDTGIWIPKAYDGTITTPSQFLEFKDGSDLGTATSGLDADTMNNITAADQATDTPTNNFCIGNNLVNFSNPSGQVVTEGGTLMTKGANGYETISGTIYVTRGKWYCEVQSILNSNTTAHIGVMPSDSPIIGVGGGITNFPGSQSGDGGVSYYANNGNKYLDAGNSSYGDSWTSGAGLGAIMGIALDIDNGKVYFAKANTWQNSGDPTSGATGTGAIDLPSPTKAYTMCCDIYANNNSIAINYGGFTYTTISSGASDANGHGTFEYAPPSGYFALCTKNLAEFG